ncbi:BolA family protein [Lichenibacterium dinghuense]|uniref:BolA family protein n=1 Tax=Lichenibacterium dinghuense TaxID=2895977 RepID=UPI001F35C37E|nr:BolA family protein [Lichenibacterium sp. 6Y81]
MSAKDRIVAALTEGLRPQSLDVIDESHHHAGHMGSRPSGETHFRVRITAEAFANKSRVDRHRAVNALLADELQPNGVHALAIEARAPGEAGR